MPKKCCVSNCKVQQDDPEGLRLSFFKIPADETAKKQWLESIKQHCDIDLKKYSFVCSRHFEKECFDTACTWLKNGKLKKGCCPTIFVNFKNLKRIMPRKKSSLHNVCSRNARLQRARRARESEEETAARNAAQRIRIAEIRRQESQEQRDKRLQQCLLSTRAARQRNIARLRELERTRQQTSRALTRASFFRLVFDYGAVHGRKILKDGCLPTLHLTKKDIKKESDNSVDIVQEISTDSGLSAAHLHTEVNIEDDFKHEPASESDDEDMKISNESCSLKTYSRKSYGAVHVRKILKDGCLPTLHLTKKDIKKESDNSVDIVQEISTDSGLAAHLHTEVNIEDDFKHEPASESDDEDMKISKESCSLKKYSRKRKLNPETSPNNSEPVNPKTIINPSTNLPLYQFTAPQTISQDPSTHNKLPLNLNEDSFNSNPISPQENSSYFQFFRSIHSDYLVLSAKKKRWFKRQCLNFLYNLLDDDSDHKISTYSQDNVKLSNSGHSEENKDVNPFAEDDYILPNN